MKNLRYNSGATMISGVILMTMGTYFWVTNYYPEFDLFGILNLDKNWPFFIVIVGFYLIVRQYKNWHDSNTK